MITMVTGDRLYYYARKIYDLNVDVDISLIDGLVTIHDDLVFEHNLHVSIEGNPHRPDLNKGRLLNKKVQNM